MICAQLQRGHRKEFMLLVFGGEVFSDIHGRSQPGGPPFGLNSHDSWIDVQPRGSTSDIHGGAGKYQDERHPQADLR